MAIDLGRAVLRHCAELFGPLTALADPDGLTSLLDEIGWDSQALGITDPSVFAATVNALEASLDAAGQVLGQDNVELSDLTQALESLGVAAASAVKALTSLSLPPGVPADALAKLGEDLLNYLLVKHFVSCFPRLAVAASLLGVLTATEPAPVTGAHGDVLRQSTAQYVIDLSAVRKALTDPLAYARTSLLLDSAGVRRAADAVADLAGPDAATALGWAGLGASYGIIPPDPTVSLTQAEQDAVKHLLLIVASLPTGPLGALSALSVALGLTDDTQTGEGLGLLAAVGGDLALSLPTSGGTLAASVSGARQPLVITGQSVRLASGAAQEPALMVKVAYATNPGAAPAVRMGSAGTRLEVDSLGVAVSVTSTAATVDFTGTADLTGLLLALKGADGDGFLSTVLPSGPIEVRGDLGLDASMRKGVQVRGGAALQWRLGVGKSIGPILVEEVQASLQAAGGTVSLAFSASLVLALGPLTASIEAVGLRARLASPPDHPGSVVSVGFKPPDGIGLAVEAGPVSGGGFIEFDEALQQYAGALELDLQALDLTAVGLLTTLMPDGSKGFSLLVIISAQFSPIQLGFGFTLNGIGGLVGINRGINVDFLQAGLKDGTLDSIRFPHDVVANAPRIISDLRNAFPVQEKEYVFGPMVALGWGTPTMIELQLGLVLQLPSPLRLLILGTLIVALPGEDEAVVLLKLDLLGVIDFDKGEASLGGALRESHIATFPVSGQMAMRASFHAPASFALSAGGLNPRFQAPPKFPALDRMSIALSTSENPRLRLEAYFAATANTAQHGARLDVYVHKDLGALGDFTLDGYAGYDGLVTLLPVLSFITDIAAGLTLRRNGDAFASVTLNATLSGFSPWHACGTAKFSVFGASKSIDFDLTVGDPVPGLPLPPIDPLGLLIQALEDNHNWAAGAPSARDKPAMG